MDKVRVGIVGSKFAANFHADSYKRNDKVEIVAVAAIDALEEFSSKWNVPDTYEDYNEMLARDDIDLVSVCVPNFLHHDVVIAAARAGKHIVCEKPLATTVADAEEMVKVCKEAGVKLFYAEDWVFAPALNRASQIIEEGGIGDVLYIKARETHNGSHSPFAKKKSTCGGGCLIHLGIHPIGYVLYMLAGENNPPVEVVAKTTGGLEKNYVHKDFEGEDWAAGIITFADGRNALVEGNYITVGGMDDVVDIYGTDGRIIVNLTFGSCLDVYSRKGYGYAIEKADFTYGWTKPAVDEFFNLGYVEELRYFVDCVLNDTAPKFGVDGESGLLAMKVVEAMYKSAEEGKTIPLDLKV
ncbi:MAG: Gfo/Idh/MocA family oxidoreductase [Planctomycetes bacterium]|nr:Gfo/Idh/MocA family oxidoreductase [Planctomycetota bacterium]